MLTKEVAESTTLNKIEQKKKNTYGQPQLVC